MVHKLMISVACFVFGASLAKPILDGIFVELQTGGSRFFEEHFNESIECVRRKLMQGNAEAGIPSFDPLRINETVHLKIDNVLLWTDLKLTDVVIDGLVAFKTEYLNLSPLLLLDAGFHFNKIHASARYKGRLNVLGLIGIFGEGDMEFEISKLDMPTSTQFEMVPPLIGNFSVIPKVRKVKIRITGLMGDESLSLRYSVIASRAVTMLINIFSNHVSNFLSPVVIEHLNLRSGNLTFLDFLARVTNATCSV